LRILPDDFLRRYKAILEIPLTADGRKEVVKELQTLFDEIEILTDGRAEHHGPNQQARR
jgi:hypothetical protein